MKHKLYPIYIKGMTAIFSASLAATLIGCTSAENKIQDTTSAENTQTVETEENLVDNENLTQEENTVDTDDLTQEEKDSAANTAIELMLEGAQDLKDSASEAASSEEVQEELDRSMQNFKDLSDFIFNGKEIGGVTFSELSDEGKEMARNALNSLDETLNDLVPNYRERFKEWFTDKAASGLDALSELKDEGLDLWDEIQTKRKSK